MGKDAAMKSLDCRFAAGAEERMPEQDEGEGAHLDAIRDIAGIGGWLKASVSVNNKLGEREQIELWRVSEGIVDGVFNAAAGASETRRTDRRVYFWQISLSQSTRLEIIWVSSVVISRTIFASLLILIWSSGWARRPFEPAI